MTCETHGKRTQLSVKQLQLKKLTHSYKTYTIGTTGYTHGKLVILNI